MRLVATFKNETDTNVWSVILDNLHDLSGFFADTKFSSKFNEFFSGLLQNVAKRVGFEVQKNDGYTKNLLIIDFLKLF
jgi:hypothetical protein